MRFLPLCCSECSGDIVLDGGIWRHSTLKGAQCDWGQPFLKGAAGYLPQRVTWSGLEEAA